MNRQRGYVQLIIYAVMAIAAAAAIGGLYYQIMHWCNTACEEVKTELDEATAERDVLKTEKQEAQDRATSLALLWADGINRVEVRYVTVDKIVREKFASLRDRARGLHDSGTGTILLSSGSVQLLNDAHRAANDASDTAAAQVDNGPTQTVSPVSGEAILTPEGFNQFYIESSDAYSEAYRKWKSAVDAYNTLREEVNREREAKVSSGTSAQVR